MINGAPNLNRPGPDAARDPHRDAAPSPTLIVEAMDREADKLEEMRDDFAEFNKTLNRSLTNFSGIERLYSQFVHGKSPEKMLWEELFNKYIQHSREVEEIRPYINSLKNLDSTKERAALFHMSAQEFFKAAQNPQIPPQIRDQVTEAHEESCRTIQRLEKSPAKVQELFEKVEKLNRTVYKKLMNYAMQNRVLLPKEENILARTGGFLGNAIGATLKGGVRSIIETSKFTLKATVKGYEFARTYPKTAAVTAVTTIAAFAGAAYYYTTPEDTTPEAISVLVRTFPDRIVTEQLSPIANATETAYSTIVNAGSAVVEGVSSAVKDVAFAEPLRTATAVGSLGVAGAVAAQGKRLYNYVRNVGLKQAIGNHVGKTAAILTPVAFIGGEYFFGAGTKWAYTTAAAGAVYEIAQYAASKLYRRIAQ